MRTLDEARIRLKLEKCKFAQEQTDWLGLTLSQKCLERTLLIDGAINQMNRFIRILAQLCAPLLPLLSKAKKTKGTGRKTMKEQLKK